MKLSDYVADFLAKQGIRHVFAVSGGASVHLIDSIANHPKIDFVCPQHEQAGAMAAAPFGLSEIRERYRVFRQQLSTFNEVLQSFAGTTIYGYGAAQMLPVLAYHMGNDLASLMAILDDDPSRDGWYYRNLIPPIRYSGTITDLQMATVLVTAVDNIQPILSKLLAHRPRHMGASL